MLDRIEVIVSRMVLVDCEQPLTDLGDGLAVAPAFGRELAQEVDDRAGSFGWVRPEAEGEVTAEQVEVEVDEPLLALPGEILCDTVGARESSCHVLDDGAIFLVAKVTLGLSLLKGLGGSLVVSVSHKLRLHPAV